MVKYVYHNCLLGFRILLNTHGHALLLLSFQKESVISTINSSLLDGSCRTYEVLTWNSRQLDEVFTMAKFLTSGYKSVEDVSQLKILRIPGTVLSIILSNTDFILFLCMSPEPCCCHSYQNQYLYPNYSNEFLGQTFNCYLLTIYTTKSGLKHYVHFRDAKFTG